MNTLIAAEDGAEVILGYVRAHPGSTGRQVVQSGRGHLSRRQARAVIKALLREPRRLRSDHPRGPGVYDDGSPRLYLVPQQRLEP